MTYEATKVELYGANNDGTPVSYVYSGTTTALKGTLMGISGGATNGQRICTKALALGDPCAGIAASDVSGAYVLGTDYPRVSVWTQGVFNMITSGVIKPGDGIFCASETGSANWVMSTSGTGVQRIAAKESGCPFTIGYALTYQAAEGGTANVKLML